MRLLLLLCLVSTLAPAAAQKNATLQGQVSAEGMPLPFATVRVVPNGPGTTTDTAGYFTLEVPSGAVTLDVSYLGYASQLRELEIGAGEAQTLNLTLAPAAGTLDEVVVTGTLRPVRRAESPVPVEVYNPVFFQKNPTPNLFEALQNVNGVRPQLNCQVCGTGDIHINGLEGPYTMVLIDGMPIVSSLATVYGLSGIPNSLIQQVEIVRGPASSLYGSEAIGGLINVITRRADKAPVFTADIMRDSWNATNADLGFKVRAGERLAVLTGVNYYRYNNPTDKNGDNFTDVTLAERLSVFQKWQVDRPGGKLATLAGRLYTEDRWGGELQWNESFRGGTEVYGEAIDTDRWELLGQYQLPGTENLLLSASVNSHRQRSVYGDTPYDADQRIAFGRLTWDKSRGRHDLLLGTSLRYTFYDDNTTATVNPDEITIPGIFAQDEITLHPNHQALLGLRYDYDARHGNILTPRLAYKWSASPTDMVRLNAGTGFRVVNLFTEEHAALTGAREVVIAEALDPEQSWNVNLNYTKKIYAETGSIVALEATAWYTRFQNQILPDYDTDPNLIVYDNLAGHATTRGLSINADASLANGWSFVLGASLLDVQTHENGVSERQILTENYTATWSLSRTLWADRITVDYTGNLYGPMRLPTLGPLDPRPEDSPVWSIQNLQLSYRFPKRTEIYGGVKNLLDWTPWRATDEPIIARAFDPFDRNVSFNPDGSVMPTENNPNALTFDPTYVYASNQGRQFFLGVRYTVR